MTTPGHIVLVGLPGAGKTTVGRELARRLGRPFIDLDDEIARREGMSVAEIFAARGESYFRGLEAAFTRELVHSPPAVVAPGGGWIVQPGLADVVRPPATIVHLRVSPEAALVRMGATVQERPLLAGPEAASRLASLWNARRQAYETADVEVQTDLLSTEQVTDALLALIGWSGA